MRGALLLALAATASMPALEVDRGPGFEPDRLLVRDRSALERVEARLGGRVAGGITIQMEPTMPEDVAALYNQAQLAEAMPKLLGLLFSGDADLGLQLLIRVINL